MSGQRHRHQAPRARAGPAVGASDDVHRMFGLPPRPAELIDDFVNNRPPAPGPRSLAARAVDDFVSGRPPAPATTAAIDRMTGGRHSVGLAAINRFIHSRSKPKRRAAPKPRKPSSGRVDELVDAAPTKPRISSSCSSSCSSSSSSSCARDAAPAKRARRWSSSSSSAPARPTKRARANDGGAVAQPERRSASSSDEDVAAMPVAAALESLIANCLPTAFRLSRRVNLLARLVAETNANIPTYDLAQVDSFVGRVFAPFAEMVRNGSGDLPLLFRNALIEHLAKMASRDRALLEPIADCLAGMGWLTATGPAAWLARLAYGSDLDGGSPPTGGRVALPAFWPSNPCDLSRVRMAGKALVLVADRTIDLTDAEFVGCIVDIRSQPILDGVRFIDCRIIRHPGIRLDGAQLLYSKVIHPGA